MGFHLVNIYNKNGKKPLQAAKEVASITTVNGELWAAYSEANDIFILKRSIDGIWTTPKKTIKGHSPNLSFDGEYLHLFFEYNDKIQRLDFLPEDLGDLSFPLQLWDGVDNRISTSGNILATRQIFSSTPFIGVNNRSITAPFSKNSIRTISVLDDYPGAQETPISLDLMVLGGSWNHIAIPPGFINRKYRFYEEDTLIGETSSHHFDFIGKPFTSYSVTSVLTFYNGEEFESIKEGRVLGSEIGDIQELKGEIKSTISSVKSTTFDYGYDTITISKDPLTGDSSRIGLGTINSLLKDISTKDFGPVIYGTGPFLISNAKSSFRTYSNIYITENYKSIIVTYDYLPTYVI